MGLCVRDFCCCHKTFFFFTEAFSSRFLSSQISLYCKNVLFFFVIYKTCLEQTNLILVLIYHKLNFITNNFFSSYFPNLKMSNQICTITV